jgi:adenine C2-methylase RlmN of 23S rRNA A2503 and tRNA A37
MIVSVPISIGELIDKITILEIKRANAQTLSQANNVTVELTHLSDILHTLSLPGQVVDLTNQLKQVNLELWHIEDSKRHHEKQKQFDDKFIELARNVYIKNDLRASIKRQINTICNSTITEEKIY